MKYSIFKIFTYLRVQSGCFTVIWQLWEEESKRVFAVCKFSANKWKKNNFKMWYLLLFDSTGLWDCLSAKLEIHTYRKSSTFGLNRTMEQMFSVMQLLICVMDCAWAIATDNQIYSAQSMASKESNINLKVFHLHNVKNNIDGNYMHNVVCCGCKNF